MIQLSYQPAFDATHAIFRFLRIREALGLLSIEVDKLRILDYYLLFPPQASEIRLRQSDLWIRNAAKKFERRKSSAKLPSKEVLFEKMKSPQVAALQTMVASGSIDAASMRQNLVKFQSLALPPSLTNRVKEANEREADVMKIVEALQHYPLLGKDGLKDRTGLLEYRYDQV